MSTKNLPGLLTLGNHKIEHRKFEKAEKIFTSGINQLEKPETDEDVELKASFLLQRSLCMLFTDKKEAALEDANAAFDLCSKNEEKFKAIIATVHLRRGQVNELNAKLLEA